jgi:hypothetical protein
MSDKTQLDLVYTAIANELHRITSQQADLASDRNRYIITGFISELQKLYFVKKDITTIQIVDNIDANLTGLLDALLEQTNLGVFSTFSKNIINDYILPLTQARMNITNPEVTSEKVRFTITP